MPDASPNKTTPNDAAATTALLTVAPPLAPKELAPKEIGGRGGLDPTRYGDWEKNGRCIDF